MKNLLLVLFTFAHLSSYGITFTSYKIDPRQCHRIITKTGTVIYIPENSFDGTKGTIEIQYREYQSLEDILSDKISMLHKTKNTTRLLETGGMFEIYALKDGNKISLKPGQAIDVTFAARKDLPNLKVFYYDHSNANWLLTDKKYATEKGSATAINPNAATSGKPNIFNTPAEGDGYPEDSVSRRKRIEAERLKTAVFRTLSIDKMGLYNYDHIMNEQNALIADVEFKMKGDNKPFTGVVYCIHSSFNTVTYHYNGELSPFPYSPEGRMSFFTILNTNTVVKISEQQVKQFQKADKKQKITLILDENYRFEKGNLMSIIEKQ